MAVLCDRCGKKLDQDDVFWQEMEGMSLSSLLEDPKTFPVLCRNCWKDLQNRMNQLVKDFMKGTEWEKKQKRGYKVLKFLGINK